ncbi:MAG: CaiB/BaiF CoA-transferase family protein [Dehalococcoidia bacterium]
MLPLDDIKVLDLSTRAPGPFCSMALSDLGADVLLVEAPPGTGSLGRPSKDADPVRDAAYNPLRRNKRSIILNLKDRDARELLYRLARDADVVMEGFRPGVVDRLGIGYDTLKDINPRIVYCAISGYGQDGPYSQLPGHDVNYLSFAGVLGIIGSRDGQPVIPYNLIADFASGGLLSAMAILSALWVRQRTGQGQYIDMSLADGSLYLMTDVVGSYHATGVVPKPGAMRLNGGSPDYQAYRCKDGKYLSIGSLEPKFWVNTCTALGREDMVPRRETEPDAVLEELRQIFATRPRDEWFALLADKDVCVGKVNTVDELGSDPQVRARGMMVDVPGPDGRAIPQVGIAAHLRGTPGRIRWAGPAPGAQTREVLEGLGVAADEIERLRATGAVG